MTVLALIQLKSFLNLTGKTPHPLLHLVSAFSFQYKQKPVYSPENDVSCLSILQYPFHTGQKNAPISGFCLQWERLQSAYMPTSNDCSFLVPALLSS